MMWLGNELKDKARKTENKMARHTKTIKGRMNIMRRDARERVNWTEKYPQMSPRVENNSTAQECDEQEDEEEYFYLTQNRDYNDVTMVTNNLVNVITGNKIVKKT